MQRLILIAGFLGAVGLLAVGVWSYGYRQALDSLSLQAEGDLELAAERLSAELQRYQETAVLMADHPILAELNDPARLAMAQDILLDVADKTSALDVFYVDGTGRVLVSARGGGASSVAGEGYFQRAMQGALGSAHGLFRPSGLRAYYYAAPDFGPDGKVRGALVVVADIAGVEWDWRGSTPAVLFTDNRGEVFISNRSELLFWRRPEPGAGLIPPEGDPKPFRESRVGRHEIWQVGWGPYLPRSALHLTQDLPVIDMTGEVLVSVAPSQRLALLQAAAVAAICLAFGAMLFLATERRRTLAQANAVLESRVAERTRAVTATNTQLRREIAERQDAEAALKRAQADLVQAGKLSALGQMSAGISHELNQPLMAIQQFAENGTAFLDRGKSDLAGDNLTRISGLAARMARIIKNLRAFVRNESEPMGQVDLVHVLSTAVELVEPRLRSDKVELVWDKPAGPVLVIAGEVRLIQVFVNLINNAADAMLDQPHKRIVITLTCDARQSVTIRDTGPGIEDPERIFEPFYSTKAVGSSEGMGLGLSISYGLVQSFGGDIRGRNTEAGAEFTVELDRYQEGKAA